MLGPDYGRVEYTFSETLTEASLVFYVLPLARASALPF